MFSKSSIYRDENEEMKKQLKKCVNWRGRRSRASGGRVWEGGYIQGQPPEFRMFSKKIRIFEERKSDF